MSLSERAQHNNEKHAAKFKKWALEWGAPESELIQLEDGRFASREASIAFDFWMGGYDAAISDAFPFRPSEQPHPILGVWNRYKL